MKRLQTSGIIEDLHEKMVFLSGPRQVGKTTLAKHIAEQFSKAQYLNYDEEKDRRMMVRKEWSREQDLIILDEIHKLKKWKSHLKGVYDTEGIPPRLIITGSARLDVYRRGGDSLAGRYFNHRLYPLSVRELRGTDSPDKILDNLLQFGGFPEPYLGRNERKAARWRKQHIERIVRIDVQDLEPVRDIQTLILLIDMLKERVGSPLSYNSVAQDLEISPHTVKRWITILENMYLIFKVTPYHKNLGRAHLKEPKIYFYDTGCLPEDEGIRLENQVANCLLKHLHFLEDSEGKTVRLHYIRDKEKREIDFLTLIDGKTQDLIEVKNSKEELNKDLRYYQNRIRAKNAIQLVRTLKQEKTVDSIHITSAAHWLDQLAV